MNEVSPEVLAEALRLREQRAAKVARRQNRLRRCHGCWTLMRGNALFDHQKTSGHVGYDRVSSVVSGHDA